jgi:hypothetical protein
MVPSTFPELGEELFLFLAATKQMKPGDHGGHVFARTLSGATPDSFAEALQRILVWLSLFYRENLGLSEFDSSLMCGDFEAKATAECARLRAASGATKAGRS